MASGSNGVVRSERGHRRAALGGPRTRLNRATPDFYAQEGYPVYRMQAVAKYAGLAASG